LALFNPTDKLLLSALSPTDASRERARRLVDENAADIDWAALLRRADQRQIVSLVRYNLSRLGLPTFLPIQIQSKFDEISRLWAARHLAYVSETSRLISAYKGAGIDALPLKGAALMLGGYYPEAGLRAALDIDLLVDPGRLALAEEVARGCGYEEIPGRREIRARQRLENERNHLWPRRGPGGLILELHHRAFHFAKGGRDFGYTELIERARLQRQMRADDPPSPLLPSPSDLATHLIHHSIVDLQSAHSILRTISDLGFIFARAPQSCGETMERARLLGFAGAAQSAVRVLRLLEEASLAQLDASAKDGEIGLLLDLAMAESTDAVADAARLFEYLDFSVRPAKKLGGLFSLLFTSRSHMEHLYGDSERGRVYLNYLRRPFDLIRKLKGGSLSPATLRRVRRLRRLSVQERPEESVRVDAE
jgi:hypothetical protein